MAELTKEQHQERANQDARTSNEFGRAGAQAAILINGGAATALLAFFSSVMRDGADLEKVIDPFIPLALIAYAAGVLMPAIALLSGSRAIELFMEGHENLAPEGADIWKRALKLWNRTLALIFSSLICFVVATVFLACEFARWIK